MNIFRALGPRRFWRRDEDGVMLIEAMVSIFLLAVAMSMTVIIVTVLTKNVANATNTGTSADAAQSAILSLQSYVVGAVTPTGAAEAALNPSVESTTCWGSNNVDTDEGNTTSDGWPSAYSYSQLNATVGIIYAHDFSMEFCGYGSDVQGSAYSQPNVYEISVNTSICTNNYCPLQVWDLTPLSGGSQTPYSTFRLSGLRHSARVRSIGRDARRNGGQGLVRSGMPDARDFLLFDGGGSADKQHPSGRRFDPVAPQLLQSLPERLVRYDSAAVQLLHEPGGGNRFVTTELSEFRQLVHRGFDHSSEHRHEQLHGYVRHRHLVIPAGRHVQLQLLWAHGHVHSDRRRDSSEHPVRGSQHDRPRTEQSVEPRGEEDEREHDVSGLAEGSDMTGRRPQRYLSSTDGE